MKFDLFCFSYKPLGSMKSASDGQIIVLLGASSECTRVQILAVNTKSVFVWTANILTPGAL